MNRLELIGETLHQALNALAEANGPWLKTWVPPEWFDRYGRSFNEYRLPLEDAERDQLAMTIGQDGWSLLHALYEDPHTPPTLRELRAV